MNVPVLQQIVLNLLTNAIKFTPANGTIRLSVTDGVDSVSIHVHDTGRGIAAEKLEHISVPFVRLDSGYAPRDPDKSCVPGSG